VKLVIAIDGPAAAGKGTLAKRLAAHFGLPHLDTGLLYRATGRRVLDRGGDPTEPATAEAAARALRPEDFARTDLRGPEADAAAAAVASIPAVRAALLQFQRDFGRERGAVLDGRDIGTIVFPDAPAKLFVTASVEARGRRRSGGGDGAGAPARPAGPRPHGGAADRRAGRTAARHHRTGRRRDVRAGAGAAARAAWDRVGLT
jgi:CMP/dCMP kinase